MVKRLKPACEALAITEVLLAKIEECVESDPAQYKDYLKAKKHIEHADWLLSRCVEDEE